MYLGKKRVKARGFFSGFSKVPLMVSSEELNLLVEKLRNGDNSVKQQIVEGHMGLMIQIIGRYVNFFPMKGEDMVGVAMLELIKAVDKFQYCSKDNNITPYIVSHVHGEVSDFIKTDHIVTYTNYGADKAIEDNKKGTGEGLPIIHSFELVSQHKKHINKSIQKLCIHVDHNESNFAYEETIESLNLTRLETIVLKGLCDSKTETEIGKEINYSRSMICKVKVILVNKLKPFFLEQ